jgi:Domain of unknown function (DUF4129)
MLRLWPTIAGGTVFVILACMAAALSPTTSAQSTTGKSAVELDLPAYKAELDRCAEALQHPEEIPPLRKSLPRTWIVRAGQSQMEVSTQWLSAGLRHVEESPAKSKSAMREVQLRLSAMRNAVAELEDASTEANYEQAHAQLEQILQRREFSGASGPSQAQILAARLMRWIVERLVWLFTRLHLGGKAGNFLAWSVILFAFLVLAYWVWLTLARVLRTPGLPVSRSAPSDDSRLWVNDALAAAERGDYREAVHCAYWAAIVRLEGLGLLKRDRARTPRESLSLLEPYPKEQKLLRDFTRHFELIWYGYRPASLEDWSGARSHLEKMGCLTPSTPATANS